MIFLTGVCLHLTEAPVFQRRVNSADQMRPSVCAPVTAMEYPAQFALLILFKNFNKALVRPEAPGQGSTQAWVIQLAWSACSRCGSVLKVIRVWRFGLKANSVMALLRMRMLSSIVVSGVVPST